MDSHGKSETLKEQVDAIANRDWQVEASTQRWTFVPVASPVEAGTK